MSMFGHATGIVINGGVFNAIQGDPATIERMKEIPEDDSEERQKIMTWTSPIDVSVKHSDVSNTRQPGTGEWFLNSEIYQEWESCTGRALWCSGIPGAGKTVLSSLIIDHLHTLQLRKPFGTMAVAWVYFNYKEELTQTPDNIFLSLIRQLARLSDELYNHLRSEYRRNPNSRASARRLIPDMGILTQEFDKVFIIIDALDECAADNRDTILDLLSDLQGLGANILITSRDNAKENIDDSGLVGIQRIDIRGTTDDVTAYINARLQKRLARIIRTDPSLHKEIVTAIVDSCQGMFLMATFHIESLRKHLTAGKVRKALKLLPKNVPGIYADAMCRIESDTDHSEDALRILSFLIHARRPLTMAELQHFIAITPDGTDIDNTEIVDKDILLSICAGIVVMDDKTSIVRLVHFTAQEYFDNIRESKFPLGDLVMGRACLTYLSLGIFRGITDLSESWSRYVLLEYIIRYWHVHISAHQEALRSSLCAFFRDDKLLCAYFHSWQSYYQHPGYENQLCYGDPCDYTGLQAAAGAGLLQVVGWMLADNVDVNFQGPTGRTALLYAMEGGHLEVVDLLLANGANVNARGSDGTALLMASQSGQDEIVKLLLANGAEVESRNELSGTPLWEASSAGYKTIVKLLLENGANVNTQAFCDAPLAAASRGGHEAIVKLLLGNGADVNAGGGDALVKASRGGHAAVAKLLLENGADINAHWEGWNLTPLQAASKEIRDLPHTSDLSHEAVVRLLLEHGANPNAQAGLLGTPLLEASYRGHKGIVKQLLENGADANVQGGQGGRFGTPLIAASERGHEEIVKLLLKYDADVNAQGGEYGTPLLAASEGSHEAIVKLLLENGADIDSQGGEALLLASKGGSEAVVKLLLENGANVNSKGGKYGTALLAAVEAGKEMVAKLLLENGADVNAQSEMYGTALLAASKGGHETIAKLLLDHGADVNTQGGMYGTALLLENGADVDAEVEIDEEAWARIAAMMFEKPPRCAPARVTAPPEPPEGPDCQQEPCQQEPVEWLPPLDLGDTAAHGMAGADDYAAPPQKVSRRRDLKRKRVSGGDVSSVDHTFAPKRTKRLCDRYSIIKGG